MSTSSKRRVVDERVGVDGVGDASPASLFSADDRTLIMGAILAACDADDGLDDGMIFNTGACGFDPAVLACGNGSTDDCLTAGQVAGLEKAFLGPIDSKGNQVYPPFPWDTGLNATGGGLPGILASGGSSPVQSQRTSGTFDVDAEAHALASDVLARIGDSLLPNLSTFRQLGSKILFYQGMSEPWFSGHDTWRPIASSAPATRSRDGRGRYAATRNTRIMSAAIPRRPRASSAGGLGRLGWRARICALPEAWAN